METTTIESRITRISINKLVISPLNVRKRQATGIEELAALIASQGLIHNLVVTEQVKKGKKTGKHEVVAGGRRLAALNLLIAEGRLPKDHQVECRVVGRDEALQMSLAENSGREGMHPADLVMAYRSLAEAGLSPDEIGPRYGVSSLTVKRYLKLTNVSPNIFRLYAEDKMTLRADSRAGAYRGSRLAGATLEQYAGVAAQRADLPAADHRNRNQPADESACQVRGSRSV